MLSSPGTSRDIDVLVVGAAGVDTVVYPPHDWSWSSGGEGTLAEVRDVVAHGGGYAARGYAALGYRTAFLGHVGHDDQGRLVRRTLTDDGIVVDGLVTSGMTAHSVNIMDAAGSRRNFYDPRLTDVDPPDETTTTALLGRTHIAHVNIPDWARRVLEPARERNVTLVVDVQDASGLDDSYRRDFVRAADLLFVSADRLADPERYARGAMEIGHAQAVVVGMGSRGCLLVPQDQPSRTYPAIGTLPDDGSGHTSRPVLDTNGAGDSLAVGVASALLLDGLSTDAAVRRGLLCARWCCTLRGTSDGLATHAQLEAWKHALSTSWRSSDPLGG